MTHRSDEVASWNSTETKEPSSPGEEAKPRQREENSVNSRMVEGISYKWWAELGWLMVVLWWCRCRCRWAEGSTGKGILGR